MDSQDKSPYLDEVAQSFGGSSGASVDIINASHLQHLLGDTGGDNAGTAGGGDQPHGDTAALARHLDGHCVGLADLVTPVPAADGHHRHLRQDDGTANGSCNLQ